jgi:heptosyltransferase III
MKVLCIQLKRLGDVIMTTPAVRQLRALLPHAEISFLTEPPGAHVYRRSPHIDRLWTVPEGAGTWAMLRLLRAVRAERFDLVLDFFSNPRSAQVAWVSRAGRRIGFGFRGRRYAYTEAVSLPDPQEYAARSKNRLVLPLGGELDDVRTELRTGSEADERARHFCEQHAFGDRTIAFGVVQRRRQRLYEPSFYAEIGERLAAAGYRLFLIHGPGEEALVEEVRSRLRHRDSAISGYDVPTIEETVAILRRCVLYVGNDGGSKHLGVCAGIPTVTLFRVSRAENWTPPGHVAFQHEDGVTPAAVLEQCFRLLGRRD